jgi:hypothetical protein
MQILIRDLVHPGSWIRDPRLKTLDPIRDPGWKTLDLGSEINILDPQHYY